MTHGFAWSGEVRYQSAGLARYQEAADRLLDNQQAYPCRCSRKTIKAKARRGPAGYIYPGTCRRKTPAFSQSTSLRFRCRDSVIQFNDRRQGPISSRISDTLGDFVIQRRDRQPAYLLATVVDDALDGITEVVRGRDLLAHTPAQIALQEALGLPTPGYLHTAVVMNPHGQKLSKQTGAAPLDGRRASENLWRALRFLGQSPPTSLAQAPTSACWEWAAEHWQAARLPAGNDPV